jgi:hypothetical protein
MEEMSSTYIHFADSLAHAVYAQSEFAHLTNAERRAKHGASWRGACGVHPFACRVVFAGKNHVAFVVLTFVMGAETRRCINEPEPLCSDFDVWHRRTPTFVRRNLSPMAVLRRHSNKRSISPRKTVEPASNFYIGCSTRVRRHPPVRSTTLSSANGRLLDSLLDVMRLVPHVLRVDTREMRPESFLCMVSAWLFVVDEL